MDPDARADVIDDLQLDQAFEDLDHKFLVLEGQTDADTLLSQKHSGDQPRVTARHYRRDC
ncbi:hypothetical protein GCM10028820_11530 [Tessaracoccus terricola]